MSERSSADSTHERIDWRLGHATAGAETEVARRAHFQWKQGDSVITTQDFDEQELEEQIDQLEARGEPVPEEFREALESFRAGSAPS